MQKYICVSCHTTKLRQPSEQSWKGSLVKGKRYENIVYKDAHGRKFQGNKCPDCHRTYLKQWQRDYQRTKKGIVMRAYVNIVARCTGKSTRCAHLYTGLPYVSKQEFYDWSFQDPQLELIYSQYKANGFKRVEAPSIDRINIKGGYVFGNIQWLSMRDNRAKALSENRTKLTAEQAIQLRKEREAGAALKDLMAKYGISQTVIYAILSTQSNELKARILSATISKA
jgi:hypothetical protein